MKAIMNECEKMVSKIENDKKVIKLSKQYQIKELMAQGVDKEMAKIMVDAFMGAGLTITH